jgi:hypothetical protein
MSDRPGTNPLFLAETADEEGAVVGDEVESVSSTSAQLEGTDIVVTLTEDSPLKQTKYGSANQNVVAASSANIEDSSKKSSSRKRPMSLSSTAKVGRSNRITESIMGSITDAIEKQGGTKDSWKRHEIETNKELRGQEIELQKKQYFLQSRMVKAELLIMQQKTAVEMEKSRNEAALLEEQTKTELLLTLLLPVS